MRADRRWFGVPGGSCPRKGIVRLTRLELADQKRSRLSRGKLTPFAEGDQPPPDTAGADFAGQGGAVAADAGVGALGEAVTKVDFPGFVSGLIEGVFNAIVQASIDQMEAYGTLAQNVAKTADQYMKDIVTEDQARDYLVESYPDHLEADMSGEQGRVTARRDADTGSMPDFMQDLGLPFPIDEVDDDIVEEELVPAARKRMAIDRQQLLLTLVLMGINRIVVTDGKISASAVFTLNTTDLITQHKDRTKTFEYQSKYRRRAKGFWWFKPKTRFSSETKLNVETHQDDDPEAKVDLKVKLKGNVDLRFKSETFNGQRLGQVDRGLRVEFQERLRKRDQFRGRAHWGSRSEVQVRDLPARTICRRGRHRKHPRQHRRSGGQQADHRQYGR